MAKRLILLLAMLSLLSFAVAGCGDDDNGNSPDGSDSPSTNRSGSAGDDESGNDERGTKDGKAAETYREIAKRCNQSIPKTVKLSKQAQRNLVELCDATKSEDATEKLRARVEKTCRDAVEKRFPENGARRRKALETCGAGR